MGILISIIVGIVSGWLAGEIYTGEGFGLLGNLIIGVIGAVVGGLLFGALGERTESPNIIVSIFISTIGAIIFLFLVNLIF